MGTISITGTQPNQQPTTDEETIAPFAGVAISDTDSSQTETVTVTESNPANGALSDLDGGTYDPETGAYTISGSAAAINAALGGLEFAPTPNLVAPGQTITTAFTITATDTAGGTATDGLTTVVATEVAATIGNSITLDGTFSEWPAADVVMTPANTVAGYQVYGALLNDATLGQTYLIGIDATDATDPVIGAGSVIYLNTDQNDTSGFSPFGNIGAEYEVQFASDSLGVLEPYLYSVTPTGAVTLLNGGAPLDAGFSSNGESVELAIPQALLTPDGGVAPASIDFGALVNNVEGLPGSLGVNPEYIITDPSVVVQPTTIANQITLDGTFSDWPAADMVMNPGNFAPGYQVYGAFLNDATLGNTYVIGLDATATTDPVIGAGTVIYLNTDQNDTTGYNLSFGNVGAEYEVQFSDGSNAELQPYLYSLTSAGATTELNGDAPLVSGFSDNGESVELAIPQALLTPADGAAPTSIDFATLINGTTGVPTDFTQPEYVITDPATLETRTPTHKVAIVYSDTSASLYFSPTAYSDLIMAAENQARMAGVSYDLIDESKLTNVNNLLGYDALIFPAMPNVNTTNLPAIMSALTSAVYNYHIGIITSGDFLTNDQTGAPLGGNSYANMETLLGLARNTGGNSGNVTVTANDVSNPIMQGYTAGQVIQSYTNEGYAAYQGVGGTTPDVLVNQNVAGVGTLPGVVETTTGGTNVQFATQDLLGDSNLLSNAIQNVVLGTQPGVAMDISRDAGIMAVRMDMDQSQFTDDVSPVNNAGSAEPGIYNTLLPILQQFNQQYDFTETAFINIGNDPNNPNGPETTNWGVSLPFYQEMQGLGIEIGNHSYDHLLNPPTETFTAVTATDTPAGSDEIVLTDPPPSFGGSTVGMLVAGPNIGAGVTIASGVGEGGAIANTQVTAVNGDTIDVSFIPGGYLGTNDGVLGDIPAGTTLTFSIPAENTNFLQTGNGTVLDAAGDPFTYGFQFDQSNTVEQDNLGTPIYGAAIPGANETVSTDENILPYYLSAAPTATSPGYVGFLTGGWTGVGSGYPSAIGYINPSDENSLYIAPNMTFDFTEVEYEGKTPAQADADWESQIANLTANAAGTPIVVMPIHDYGLAAWNTNDDTGVGAPETTAMYQTIIAQAYADNYEFVTMEDLASRIAAQQNANINYTTSGNTITVTVTPDPTAPDVYGEMALNIVNGGSEVIQNAGNYYAYNAQELFLPNDGGAFTVALGSAQDAVTHIESLPMRADLVSVTGDGKDLSFSVVGTGDVVVDLAQAITPSVTGASVVSQTGTQLTLDLTGTGQQNVSINLTPAPTISGTVAGQAITDLQTIAPFSGVTIADANLGQTETVTVTLSAAANGTLSNLGGGTYNAATGIYTDIGNAGSVSTDLQGLVFTPIANQVAPGGAVTTGFTITDTDTAGATATPDSTTTVIATDVAVLPTIGGTKANQAITDLQTITPFSGVTIGDLNLNQTETLTVTLSTAANGTLSNLGGFTNPSAGVYTDTGTAAAVTAALDALVFTPTENQVASGSVTTAFTITDTDTAGQTATDSTTSVVATEVVGQTFTLTTGKDTVAGGAGNNVIIAKTNTLNSTDNINGGTGTTNTLELMGGGTFNLGLPATLAGIAFITAQEGQAATAQTVTLRAGLNTTVNVASDTSGDTSPTVTIIGAANSDVINLGSGNDTVTLGSGETVTSGGGNNTFKVASATLGSVTINGGAKGTNTLDVTGGGTATMGAGITGITTVDLANATTFTANATSGLQVIGSAGGDNIAAGAADQVLSGGSGADTLTGSAAGDDIFRDTVTNTNNDTIINLLPTDTIDITDLAPATTTLSKSVVTATSTVLTLTSGATITNITLSGSYQGNFVLGADTTGGGGTDVTFVPTAGVTTVTLPSTAETLHTGPVSTTIVATSATLLPADKITGGTGAGVVNTLELTGGGAFNLAALAYLTGIQVIDAQEGEGPTAQTVTLRAGLKNATVNVTADTSGDPSPGITIIGANDSDVINLGPGADTVTLGNGETVNGGAGTDIYNVTKATIANTTIKGGSGSNTLVVTGGGNATMGSNITGINAVQLATTTKFTANSTAGLQISGSSAGGDTIILGAATQSVIGGGPKETVDASSANAGASVSGLGANSTLDITSGGTITLNANADVATVKLTSASTLILNGMAFITADGSTGKDTIQAGGIDQTLTGNGGADTLTGFSGGSDTFKDTAGHLNGVLISDFINTDTIDLTNALYSAIEKVTAAASGANTSVTVTSGATKSVFTIAGTWSSSGFQLASDGATGTFLTHS